MVDRFTNVRFEPAGMTDDPDVRMAQSLLDYVFRRLALDYLDFDIRSYMGIHTAEERTRQLETGKLRAHPSRLGVIVPTPSHQVPREPTPKASWFAAPSALERCGWNPLSKRRQSAPPGYGGAFASVGRAWHSGPH